MSIRQSSLFNVTKNKMGLRSQQLSWGVWRRAVSFTHLVMAQVQQEEFSPCSYLPVCLGWLQTPQERFSCMCSIVHTLPTVLGQGNPCLCSFPWALQAIRRLDNKPEAHRCGGHNPLHPLATLQEPYQTHSSHWHSYRTHSQFWARSCRLRYCHSLHPDKTPVPVCSDGQEWQMKVYVCNGDFVDALISRIIKIYVILKCFVYNKIYKFMSTQHLLIKLLIF